MTRDAKEEIKKKKMRWQSKVNLIVSCEARSAAGENISGSEETRDANDSCGRARAGVAAPVWDTASPTSWFTSSANLLIFPLIRRRSIYTTINQQLLCEFRAVSQLFWKKF